MKYSSYIFAALGIALVVWIIRVAMTPAPGTRMPDLGREHVSAEEVAKTTYNSNPPTSGKHVVTWVKPGIYDTPQQEGELIHSLEHGYVVIHYNCNAGQPVASGSAVVASASATNATTDCTSLIQKLTDVAKSKKLFKLAVVPRPQLDATIALAAWTYVDAFDAFDAKRIEQFIDYHRDHGPEQTME